MTAAEKIQSAVFNVLNADPTLSGLVEGVYVGPQKPKGIKNPVVLLFTRTFESTQLGALHITFFEIVVRSDTSEGEGSVMSQIANRVDTLLRNVHFSKDGASGTLNRRGFPVHPALFDDVEKDWFKRWTYQSIVKKS